MDIHTLIKKTVATVINESYHVHHADYRLLEGDRLITAIFNDNSRLQFEIHFRDKKGRLEKEKFRKRAVSKWKSAASKIHSESKELNEVGNPQEKSWKSCFEEALQDPELKEFIRDNHHQQIYPQENSGYELKQIYPYINPEDYNPNSSNVVGGRGDNVNISGA
jgi:hypothetical protein